MEVTVRHAGSGRSCVVGVADTDTVLDLKARAVGEIFAGRHIHAGRAAGGLAARIGTQGDELDDAQHIADTRLEGGDDVQLVRRWAEIKAPAEYSDTENPCCLALSPCGRLCCVGTGSGSLYVFDTTAAELLTQIEMQDGQPTDCIAFSRCGGWIAAVSQNSTTVWCTSTWECVRTLEGHTDWVYCVAWTHCGRLVSGSSDRTVRVWDVDEGMCTAVLEGHTGCLHGLAVSHTSIFSGSGDSTIRLWDLHALSHTHTLTGHTDEVNRLALTTDQRRLVSCSSDRTVKVWCTTTHQCLWSVQKRKCCFQAAVSQEGDFIATPHPSRPSGMLRLSTGQALNLTLGLPDEQTGCHCLAASPCGRWLFIAGDTHVSVHPVSTLPQQHASLMS